MIFLSRSDRRIKCALTAMERFNDAMYIFGVKFKFWTRFGSMRQRDVYEAALFAVNAGWRPGLKNETPAILSNEDLH